MGGKRQEAGSTWPAAWLALNANQLWRKLTALQMFAQKTQSSIIQILCACWGIYLHRSEGTEGGEEHSVAYWNKTGVAAMSLKRQRSRKTPSFITMTTSLQGRPDSGLLRRLPGSPTQKHPHSSRFTQGQKMKWELSLHVGLQVVKDTFCQKKHLTLSEQLTFLECLF